MMNEFLQAPIPGESLTNDPEQPQSFETPPEFTNVEKAQEHLFESLADPEAVPQLLQIIREGLPLDMLSQVILFAGFRAGKWTPDLFVLLIEPVIYILIFICEQAGVEYVLSAPEGEEAFGQTGRMQFSESMMSGEAGAVLGIDKDIAEEDLPEEVLDKVGDKIFGGGEQPQSLLAGEPDVSI